MQEFTKEYKKIQKSINTLGTERGKKNNFLSKLSEERKALLADIALGLVDTGERIRISEQVKQYEQDIQDIDIALEELNNRAYKLKKMGSHVVEVEDQVDY